LDQFTYDNIMNFRYDDNEFVIRSSSGQAKTLVRFETRQGFVIADLVHTYIKALAAMKTRSNALNTAANEVNRII
jgi:hypothetical protein